jgi:lysozyme
LDQPAVYSEGPLFVVITCIKDQLIRDEGVRLQKYPDSRGFWTIGVGHNLDAKPLPFDISNGITFAQAAQILGDADRDRGDDLGDVSFQLFADLPWLKDLDQVRQGVFLNMGFNMGVGGILEFHHDLADTQAGDYAKAAADMKASAWYPQVGDRARRLCLQMITGVWQ